MSHPLFDISGRRALVTGSSRGIGFALARGLLEAGCTVVLNGRDADRLTKAASELPGDVHTAVFDVTDGPSVAAVDVEDRVGPLDILVNNAGMQLRAPLLEFTDTDWHRILNTYLHQHVSWSAARPARRMTDAATARSSTSVRCRARSSVRASPRTRPPRAR